MAPQAAAPLVGREAEVAALVEAVGEARAGDPRCVVIAGEAGMGKTRLVAEVLGGLEDARVVTGHGADTSTGEIPFGVLADTLRDLLYRFGEGALSPAERAAMSPLLPGESDPGAVEPARILGGALDVLARLSTDRLLVWVVEDFHWADRATRDLVNLAVRGVRGRLLLLVTVRTRDPARSPAAESALTEQLDAFTRVGHVRRLDLSRLTDVEVQSMVGALTADVSPEVLRAVTRLSDGIPFLVEELAAAHGRPERATASAALAGRTARLSPMARRLVEAAAIGDGHLRISLVEDVFDIDPETFDVALTGAVGAGVLTCDLDSDQVGFRHALLRETVSAVIGPGARRAWHRRWAEVLEQNAGVLASDPALLAIAEHWHHARDVRRSVDAAYAAAPAARRVLDETRRLVLWQRILEGWELRDPDTAVGRLTLRQAIGEALKGPVNWNQPDDGVVDGFLAAAVGQPLGEPERVMLELFRVAMRSSKAGGGLGHLVLWADRQVDWLDQPADDLTREALARIARHLPASESARAEDLLCRAEELARRSGDEDLVVRLLKVRANRLGDAGDVAASIRGYEHALSRLHHAQVRHRLALTGDLAYGYIQVGRHQDADQLLTDVLENMPHLEAVPSQWEHLVENAVFNWLCTGQWQRVRQVMERAAPWWSDELRYSNLWLAELDLLQHGAMLEDRWRGHLGVQIPSGPHEVEVRGVLAQAAGLRGDLAGMRELVGPTWDGAAEHVGIWRVVVELARIEVDRTADGPDRGDRDQAAEHLDRMADVLASTVYVGPHEKAAAAELAAQTDRFRGRDPRETLAATLAAWVTIDHRPDAAITHLSMAEAHAAAGDRDLARDHWNQGRRLAAELGAGPWLDRAATIGHRYGFTTRAQRPEDLLTRREAEVLMLLDQGRTNKEIAETLVIAPKTASVHVSRIIAKMGASNRTEAVSVARRRGLVGTAQH